MTNKGLLSALALLKGSRKDKLYELEINILVDNSESSKMPIIKELNPTYKNLLGGIDKVSSNLGETNHMNIKSSSLIKANGGFLILNCKDLLNEHGLWQEFKKVLLQGYYQPKIRSQIGSISLVLDNSGTNADNLQPEPIPLDSKIILVGEEQLYYLFQRYDADDFNKIFKIKAHFETQTFIDPSIILSSLAALCNIIENENLLHFTRDGVIYLLEQISRITGCNQNKISTRIPLLIDLAREANYFAQNRLKTIKNQDNLINSNDIQQAIFAAESRIGLIRDRIREILRDGTILIDVNGSRVGQINALTVLSPLGYSQSFTGLISKIGKPAKITAAASAGRGGIIDIEREAKLSGSTQVKGVLILTGWLRSRFARNLPLSLSVSLSFEQSYGYIDGDSASAAELFVILSSLSGLPIKQSIAVTGSVNQIGEIQPIGGVNEKIEGFFITCILKQQEKDHQMNQNNQNNQNSNDSNEELDWTKLSGEQGVIIPIQNVKDLILRTEVIEAVKAKKFHIYAISKIEEGIEILTGVKSGAIDLQNFEQNNDNNYNSNSNLNIEIYPKGTVLWFVEQRLNQLAKFNISNNNNNSAIDNNNNSKEVLITNNIKNEIDFENEQLQKMIAKL
eukprot:TRINITY_DN2597_c0_g4_i1.p1 TRINITY_DN2597_c0_g4~~TRINITY_DN2597_c0_g4_i1.p1  ORF type:complete len:640 (+),score=291.01 TRINITY_DN2597_c0_g4_i1:54-1922(+)